MPAALNALGEHCAQFHMREIKGEGQCAVAQRAVSTGIAFSMACMEHFRVEWRHSSELSRWRAVPGMPGLSTASRQTERKIGNTHPVGSDPFKERAWLKKADRQRDLGQVDACKPNQGSRIHEQLVL